VDNADDNMDDRGDDGGDAGGCGGSMGDENSDLEHADFDPQAEDSDTELEELHFPAPSELIPPPEEPQVRPVKMSFPGLRAGEVLSEGIPTMKEYENNLGGPTQNPYSPFNSEIDWELAKWARLRGPSATSFTELLGINGVRTTVTSEVPSAHVLQLRDQLNLSYANSKEMNSKIDRLPGQCPKFCRSRIEVDGETFEFFYRDILACITEIYGRHDLAPYLKFKPERHYADVDMTVRLYGDICTGKWWWEIQVSVRLHGY
jgi:hypothetical protein